MRNIGRNINYLLLSHLIVLFSFTDISQDVLPHINVILNVLSRFISIKCFHFELVNYVMGWLFSFRIVLISISNIILLVHQRPLGSRTSIIVLLLLLLVLLDVILLYRLLILVVQFLLILLLIVILLSLLITGRPIAL